MLRYRLLFGTLMTLFFAGLLVFDGWLDGRITSTLSDDKAYQGTLLCALICILIIPAQFEISNLAKRNGIHIFKPIAIVGSMLFASSWYWHWLFGISLELYFLYLLVFLLFLLLLYQYFCYGAKGVFNNCGGNYFSIIYLGVLSSFVLGIRIDFGLWPVLMFIFVVKSSDIGAYTFGRFFGRRKFSPVISPGKTWEGMWGGVLFAVIVSVLFGVFFDIMGIWSSILFGVCFAFIGQVGDLAESMLKRDGKQKDSVAEEALGIPGFGGLLDVIDSPLGAAPFGYLFFLFLV